MNPMLTPQQVAELLNCNVATIYEWAKQGKIPAFKLNGAVRFDSREVEEWVLGNRIQQTDPNGQAMRILKTLKKEVDIDSIIRKSIDSVKDSGYNSH